jgi:hypothetical protein
LEVRGDARGIARVDISKGFARMRIAKAYLAGTGTASALVGAAFISAAA